MKDQEFKVICSFIWSWRTAWTSRDLFSKKKKNRTGKMAQWVRSFAGKSDYLNSIPRTSMVEREPTLTTCLLTFKHGQYKVHPSTRNK